MLIPSIYCLLNRMMLYTFFTFSIFQHELGNGIQQHLYLPVLHRFSP